MAFYFDLVPPFYFLKQNRFFSTFILVFSESRHCFSYLLSQEVCTNLQIERFPLMKLWYTTWMYRGSESQNNNIKNHPPHIYSFLNYSSRNLLILTLIIITLPWLLPKDSRKTLKTAYHYSLPNPLVSVNQNPTIMSSCLMMVRTLFAWFLRLYSWFLDRAALMNNIYLS